MYNSFLHYLLCSICVLCLCNQGTSQAITHHKIDRRDFTLHYSQSGEKGPYLVLLSGGPGSDVGYMKVIADSLNKDFKCILLEQRGTGRSIMHLYDSSTVRMEKYVEDLEALRKHLSVERLFLVGSSWGALLSLLYASAHPDRVEKIVILGAGPITSAYADIFDDNLRVRFTPLEKEIRAFWRDKRSDSLLFQKASYERDKAGMPAYYYDRNLGLAEANKLKITDVNYKIFPAFFKAHPSFDVRPLLPKIKAELLIIQGRQDPGGEANVIEIQSLVKNSMLQFIERCGHQPEIERPAETWKLVYKFLGIR